MGEEGMALARKTLSQKKKISNVDLEAALSVSFERVGAGSANAAAAEEIDEALQRELKNWLAKSVRGKVEKPDVEAAHKL